MPTVSPPEWFQRVGEDEISWRARLGQLIDAGRPRTGYNVREGSAVLASRIASPGAGTRELDELARTRGGRCV